MGGFIKLKIGTYFLSSFIQLIVWLSFYIVIGGDMWHQNKLKEIIFAFIVFSLSSIFGLITFFFRPITISVLQSNISHPDMKETLIDIQSNVLKTLQNQRTISFIISIERRGSIWWRLLNLMLKSQEITLSFSTRPEKLGLSQSSLTNPNIIVNENLGFDLILNEYFLALFKGNGTYPIDEKHEYYITIHPDFELPENATYVIDPIIHCKHKHEVKYFKKWFTSVSKLLVKVDKIEIHKIRVSKR